jgi:hypothetical protein
MQQAWKEKEVIAIFYQVLELIRKVPTQMHLSKSQFLAVHPEFRMLRLNQILFQRKSELNQMANQILTEALDLERAQGTKQSPLQRTI